MFDLPQLSIRIESPSSGTLKGIIAESGPLDTAGDTADLFAPNSEFLVARLDGRPVGCIALLDHVRYGEARRLYVVEEMRGKGIAAALVTALEGAAREIGLTSLRLNTKASHHRIETFAGFGFRAAEGSGAAWMEKRL
ncbi:GNAT family N-acetyltransferase [Ovoidimarina sediminis]|uniref:GNAT family N-acetyltransferase n=1 Tax=Ovoidimarina sediminis TaxID=3079856 RepID=UPI00290B680C|nr:GNAT family N-acetyltransferase [Rhodophyticola sp. MJ-SS7]MDU8943996.1 GNAT family N-acetyltransferase [Rhodophyticola sp. MJ-SS7]